jgi:hypothetical protein
MGAAFNLARGVQFFTPVLIAVKRYGLAGGISLAAFFALAAGAWVWIFSQKGRNCVRPKCESYMITARFQQLGCQANR